MLSGFGACWWCLGAFWSIVALFRCITVVVGGACCFSLHSVYDWATFVLCAFGVLVCARRAHPLQSPSSHLLPRTILGTHLRTPGTLSQTSLWQPSSQRYCSQHSSYSTPRTDPSVAASPWKPTCRPSTSISLHCFGKSSFLPRTIFGGRKLRHCARDPNNSAIFFFQNLP